MSFENSTTGKPSHSSLGEGCQDGAGQSRQDLGPQSLLSDRRTGGVSGGGGTGRVVRSRGEACDRGVSADVSTSGPSAAKLREADRAGAGVGDISSSADRADIKTAGERREGTCPPAPQRGEGLDDGRGDELWIKMSPKVRKLPRVLDRKVNAEPHGRFFSLYGELSRQDLLSDALNQVIENAGAPGVDGLSVETLAKDPTSRAAWLLALAEKLRRKTYRPSPVGRVSIWKVVGKRVGPGTSVA